MLGCSNWHRCWQHLCYDTFMEDQIHDAFKVFTCQFGKFDLLVRRVYMDIYPYYVTSMQTCVNYWFLPVVVTDS